MNTIPMPHEVVENLKSEIRQRHISQLKNAPQPALNTRGIFQPKPSYFSWMVQWSKQAEKQIALAIKARANGGVNIDWKIALYAFMESAAMYLRDWPSVIKASNAAREGREEQAMDSLRDSDKEIEQVAQLWSPYMHYVTICDLLEERPNSDPTLDGPYCGAFVCTDPQTPFIGLVFKGTHPESWSELLVDLHYSPVRATGGRLWGTHVSHGVFVTMFDKFAKLENQVPFNYIKQALCTIAVNLHVEADVDVHLTGHSLGAMYATLCYAELIRLHKNGPIDPIFTYPAKLIPRDLYTFGCPRLVLEDFIDVFALAMDEHDGESWRIVSKYDPVPLIPPVWLTDSKFIHLDKTYEASDHAMPEALKSERNTHPRPPLPVVAGNMSFHTPWSYYNSLYYAATH